MSVIRLTIDEWNALPENAKYAPDGVWINQPNFDTEGFALIEDSALTPGDEIVLQEIAKAPEKLPVIPVSKEEAEKEEAIKEEQTKEDLYAWRLGILTAYPEAVAKLEAAKDPKGDGKEIIAEEIVPKGK